MKFENRKQEKNMKYALTEIIGLSKMRIPKVMKDTTIGLNKTEINEASFSF